MGTTVGQLLTELEKPENEDQIKHLAHLENLSNLDELKQMRGVGGLFSKLILRFTKKHMEAFVALSKCKTTADVTAFKQTQYYDKIKSSEVGKNIDLSDLARLEELQNIGQHLD
ncbi:MAG: hypothetical protein FWC73_03130 [Defluviitaleaceae bacterium]|nr:hypothetical protein [Defluviitaleaceae bacterium]